jgi:CubicO group peptidase (beta-lactamase class C family)
MFDVASITKSIPTAWVAKELIKQGELRLDTHLADVLPTYTGDGRDWITIADLLAFRVPFALALSSLKDLPAEELLQQVLGAPLSDNQPQPNLFVNTTSILTSLVISQVTGKPLDALAEEMIFSPLKLRNTTFHPNDPKLIPPTEEDAWRGRTVQGEVHDESAWILQELIVPGSAGLFASADDILSCLISKLENPDPLELQNLGWEIQREWMGASATETTLGKTGFTGCCCVWDSEKRRAGVLLSNRTWPRRGEVEGITSVRQRFCEFVLR